MANKKLTLNPGRQYPLVAMQAFTFENVSESGVAVPLAKLPRGAVVSLLVRTGHSLAPERNTRIKTGDRLLLVSTDSARAATEQALQDVSRNGRLAGWVDRPDPAR